jgi:hypothetical protein
LVCIGNGHFKTYSPHFGILYKEKSGNPPAQLCSFPDSGHPKTILGKQVQNVNGLSDASKRWIAAEHDRAGLPDGLLFSNQK